MGPDPHIVGIIPGDHSQYGGPLYALPDHNLGERPWYAHDDLGRFKIGADEKACFNNALEYIHDLSLTVEVARFQEASCLFFTYQEEIRKIEERMWEVGQIKDASARRLEGANALSRIEAALQELDHPMAMRGGHVRTECGRST